MTTCVAAGCVPHRAGEADSPAQKAPRGPGTGAGAKRRVSTARPSSAGQPDKLLDVRRTLATRCEIWKRNRKRFGWKYEVVCTRHNGHAATDKIKDARTMIRHPEGWCWGCRTEHIEANRRPQTAEEMLREP